MTVREIVKVLRNAGWYECDTRGSHIQFKHPIKKGKLPYHIILVTFLLER